MFVAEASGLPWAVYCPYPPPFRSDDVPRTASASARTRAARQGPRPHLARKFGDRQLAPGARAVQRAQSRSRLAAVRTFDDQFLKSDRFIAFTAEPYEYHRSDWPPQVRLVGPGLWEPPAEPPAWLEAETPPDRARDRLDRVPARREADRNRARGTRRRGRGGRGDDRGPGPGPVPAYRPTRASSSSCRTARSSRARVCVVSHGGQGITQKALAAGVPVCVVPFSRDQFDVARRVELDDAGVRLHHKRLNPERLRAARPERR